MHFNILRCISFTVFSPTCFGWNSGRLQGDFLITRIKLMHGIWNILEKKGPFCCYQLSASYRNVHLYSYILHPTAETIVGFHSNGSTKRVRLYVYLTHLLQREINSCQRCEESGAVHICAA